MDSSTILQLYFQPSLIIVLTPPESFEKSLELQFSGYYEDTALCIVFSPQPQKLNVF